MNIFSYFKQINIAYEPVLYLDSNITVNKCRNVLIKMFLLTGVVKDEFYVKQCKENNVYRFERSQVDICSTCEKLNTKIKSSTLNEMPI